MLSELKANATTVQIEPGTETKDASGLHARGRVFTDRVESSSPELDGINKVTIDLDFDPSKGEGTLRGTFELALSSQLGGWTGEVIGRFEQGMVVSQGVARGSGSYEGKVIRIDFQQIKEYPGKPPTDRPLAFFGMRALLLH